MSIRNVLALLLLVCGCLVLAHSVLADPAATAVDDPQQPKPRVLLLEIEGPIGPAVADYVVRGLKRAKADNASAVVLRLSTPGGLVSTTRDIDQALLASEIPVIAWVAPGGAHAASAGTFILYASHLAAMAPGTNIGAATPVSMGGAPGERKPPASPPTAPSTPTEQSPEKETAAGPEAKALNDAVAHIRALAEFHGRNAQWGELAVREAASITASAALEAGAIEVISGNIEDLLQQAHGREVQTATGPRILNTTGALVERIAPDMRNRVLSIISNPTIAYLLLLVGLYGLLLEGYNPGAMVPGVIGLLCLLMAAYALQVLPINYVGLALILTGVALMVAELVTPSFGILGIGGLTALGVGSLMLFDNELGGFEVSRGLLAGIGVSLGALFLLVATMLGRSSRRAPLNGDNELLHGIAVATSDFEFEGLVRIRGELWKAQTSQPVYAGMHLRVTAVRGLLLLVQPLAPSGVPAVSSTGVSNGH